MNSLKLYSPTASPHVSRKTKAKEKSSKVVKLSKKTESTALVIKLFHPTSVLSKPPTLKLNLVTQKSKRRPKPASESNSSTRIQLLHPVQFQVSPTLRLPGSQPQTILSAPLKTFSPPNLPLAPSNLHISTSSTNQKPIRESPKPKKESPTVGARKGQLVITNVVCQTNLGMTLNLKKVTNLLPNTEYHPESHNACKMKIGSPNVTALIFESGRVILTGLKSVEQGRKMARYLARKLFKAGLKKDLCAPTGFSVRNVVGSVDFGHQIDLRTFSQHFKATFDPELFSSGATFRLPMPTAENEKRTLAFTFFRNGKANILGGKSEEQMLEGVELMKQKLRKFDGAFEKSCV
ncbi:hypothetical protein L596_008723 [Steinernema carpocapsae]|uniref:TATA-box-binding protein n=1 Tax=Steinernema carpocapsae TaxID=34508 RepID=A0A4U5PDM7_STECR|nr:hypothetical protein L596_008723 [Steinernema carpocapsae]